MYNFYIYPSADYIVICYSYKNYDVYFELYNDKYIYYIDAPEKYDFLEERKEIEKEETILIDINNLNSLNDLFLIIYEKTKSINERIDLFNKTINPSVLTNGKLLNKVDSYKYLCKKEGLIGFFGGIFLITLSVCSIIVMITDKTFFDEINFPLIFTIFLIFMFIIFSILVFINSIFWLSKLSCINKDLKEKKLIKYHGQITKVRLVIDPGYKSPISTLCAININIKNETEEIKRIVCPIGSSFVKGKLNKKKIKNKYIGRYIETTCLSKSKLCVNGLSELYKRITHETHRAR